MNSYEAAQEKVRQGLLSCRKATINSKEYEIYCYTKEQFWSAPWDDITLTHRGKIYHNGEPINQPFEKIFNLDEHPSTESDLVNLKLITEEFEVLDKLNGHLVIITYHQGDVIVSTKGTMTGEFVEHATVIAEEMGIVAGLKNLDLEMTLMFECLADYDPHLYSQKHQLKYGLSGNGLVLLGARINHSGETLPHSELEGIAKMIGNIPVTKRYKEIERELIQAGNLSGLFDHKDREGYVIHFPRTGFRVKVKTKQYIALRYLKNLNTDAIVNKFYRSGLSSLYSEFDEELHPLLVALEDDFMEFLHDTYIKGGRVEIARKYMSEGLIDRADVFRIHNPVEAREILYGDVSNLIQSRRFRKEFKDRWYPRRTANFLDKYKESKRFELDSVM